MPEFPTHGIDLGNHSVLLGKRVYWNLTPPLLYEEIVKRGEALIADNGPLVVYTGKCTGRSPRDKFYVDEPSSRERIWWAGDKKALDQAHFEILKNRMIEYFNLKDIFIQDCFGGADPQATFPTRIITDSAWQNLFAYNMFRHPEESHLQGFKPEFTVLVASGFETEPEIDGTRSDVAVVIHLGLKMALIAGTRYTGEIKKTIFSVLNYLYPLKGILPLHCAANIGSDEQTALFFGLSGTGKTTLSADPNRRLIGDDEHGWSDRGIFNFEGGCYAKVIRLSARDEPQIYNMTRRFGTILENVVIDQETRRINLSDESITENTRASYPLSATESFEPSGMGGHPHHVLFLTADAFGVLPPVSRLSREQAMYHFISGYTAKIAGTEKGIKEPQATFSTCFGEPFMVHHPMVYAHLLGEKIKKYGVQCWLVNTGWTGGPYGTGQRISIAHTRAIVSAILNHQLENVPVETDPVFGIGIPISCPGVPDGILHPRETWPDPQVYNAQAARLAGMFQANMAKYADAIPAEIREVGPGSITPVR